MRLPELSVNFLAGLKMTMMMNKYNRKFNTRRIRFERWYRIEVMLSYARGMTSSRKYDSASPEERESNPDA